MIWNTNSIEMSLYGVLAVLQPRNPTESVLFCKDFTLHIWKGGYYHLTNRTTKEALASSNDILLRIATENAERELKLIIKSLQ